MTDPWTGQPPTSPPSGYQPYPPAPPGYGPPQPYPPALLPPHLVAPPKKSHTTVIVLSIVGGVIVVVLLICGALTVFGSNAIHNDQVRANHDVRIAGCSTDSVFDTTVGVATVVVTNSGSDRATYDVEVSFESPSGDEKYGDANAVVSDLAPGQSSTMQATGFDQVPPAGDFKCVVTDVTRL